MNILFLGGGKRVSMARLFKRAGATKIVSYEGTTHSPISLEGKVIAGRRWSDPAILEDLTRVCREEEIDVIVPFVDGAVAVAARLSEETGIFSPVSTAEQAEAMFDKIEASRIFAEAGIPIPQSYSADSEIEQWIAKPRHGSASKGIEIIDTKDQLDRVLAHAEDFLVQERIDHRDEYTVDCYVSVKTGEPLAIVPRKRIEVSGGEVVRTETVIFPEIVDITRRVLAATGLRGAVTVQFIHDLDANRCLLMEINPRLGGGVVCSVLAQADIPALILAEAKGETPQFITYRPYTEIARYPQEVAFFN